ncbi:MAG: SoxR reducing system RseC family protein [Bacteroidales bacterium]|nr:SoxR reducing system RseC family protein [Bacteroidales bacterium]
MFGLSSRWSLQRPESKKKIIDVPNDGVTPHYVGEEVEVCLGQSLGLKAVLISYVIPVVILLILIVTLSALGKSELLAGLASVGGVAIYYFIVYLFRERLERKYEFYIKNVN